MSCQDSGCGVRGQRGFFGSSQAPVLICLPGPRRPLHVGSWLCKLQQHQSPSSSALVVLAHRVPCAVPACVTVLHLGETLLPSRAPMAGAKTCCDCKVWSMQSHRLKWTNAAWQLQPSWCTSGASPLGNHCPFPLLLSPLPSPSPCCPSPRRHVRDELCPTHAEPFTSPSIFSPSQGRFLHRPEMCEGAGRTRVCRQDHQHQEAVCSR